MTLLISFLPRSPQDAADICDPVYLKLTEPARPSARSQLRVPHLPSSNPALFFAAAVISLNPPHR
ncbi:hypothetical protein C8Q79DRAFT_955953 [Trametes meyenii]|nr:hypothetical protein C8Q79DRAFT_955953 [Trametes meyenii]